VDLGAAGRTLHYERWESLRKERGEFDWEAEMNSTFFKGAVLAALVTLSCVGATAAFAGSGIGGVCNLGESNTVDGTSTLSGTTSAAQLGVTNTATGIGAVGVEINVATGEPPLAVNSSTQVANLNASLLDGHSASAFLSSAPMAVGPASLASGAVAQPQLSREFLRQINLVAGYRAVAFAGFQDVNNEPFIELQCHNGNASLDLIIGPGNQNGTPDAADFNITWVGLNNAPHDRGTTNSLGGLRTVLGDGTGNFVVRDHRTGDVMTGTFTSYDNGHQCIAEGNMDVTTTAN
jgi:hypothetical protein